MAEKVKKLTWGAEIEKRLSKDFENLPFLRDCCLNGHGEIYQIEELLIIVRAEQVEGGYEVVWMASHGAGLNKHAPVFIEAAKSNGAKHIRFHCASDEMAVPRLVRQFKPYETERVYRIDLQGGE